MPAALSSSLWTDKALRPAAVVGGTHAGKSSTVRDINTSKTGNVTITMEQQGGMRFKTLAQNVVVQKAGDA